MLRRDGEAGWRGRMGRKDREEGWGGGIRYLCHTAVDLCRVGTLLVRVLRGCHLQQAHAECVHIN